MVVLFLVSCNTTPEISEEPLAESPPSLKTGAEVLVANAFAPLDGMTVGLIVNHTARIDTLHLGDVVQHAENVTLGAFFGPEHGIRGDADAGEEISDGTDVQTGAPVYSLYGKQRKPTLTSLDGLDALVFDIQDVGARFYTYISTMGYAMQAAAEAGIPFYVLDRPNPIGGEYIAGHVRKEGFESFVGLYPIPVAHGLTVGELALMIKGEAFLEGLEALDLRIVEMEGWDRSMRWPALGRDWRPTSPNIPDYETALVYLGTCFFEAVEASEGRGTRTPFTQVGAPWVNSADLIETLNAAGLAGVSFSAHSFTPVSIAGMSSNPRFKDQTLAGVQLQVSSVDAFDPLAVGIHLVHAFYHQAPADVQSTFINDRWMGLLGGSDSLRDQLVAGATPAEIINSWEAEVAAFRAQRAPYLLY